MKRLSITILLLATCWAIAVQATVENFEFYSESLGEDRQVLAYLPVGYDPADPDGYPAIYFLHGSNGNHTSYVSVLTTLAAEIAAGRVEPMIIIKPNGAGCNWTYFDGCGWTNSELQGDYEDYVVFDVVAEAESRYNIDARPEKRAIMGHSMGAFGAMQAALNHPDLFCAVAAHSGYLRFREFISQHIPVMIDEQATDPPWEWTPSTGVITSAWFLFAGGFSPNLDNPPYYVDFPLDSAGEIVSEVWVRWLEHDPAALAESIAPEEAPAIYFDCGTEDGFFLHPFNVSFDGHLTALGIDHEWQSYVGDHGSLLDERFPISLNFIDDAMNAISPVGDPEPGREGQMLFANAPNPVGGSTQFRFNLAQSGRVSLNLYDVSGRLRERLLDRELSAGEHRLQWDASGLPAGMYLYRLETATGHEVRKLSIVH